MKANLHDNQPVKSCAEILAETPVKVTMSALELLLITTAIGHSSVEDKRHGIKNVHARIARGMHDTHPLSMLTAAQRESIIHACGKLNWGDLKDITNNILKQLGMGE